MKRSVLSRLHTNGIYYITGTLLLVIGVPLYQGLVLLPQGYSVALASAEGGAFAPYLFWIGNHLGAFLGYRALSIAAFAALFSLPFTLFRIIVAQEILGGGDIEPMLYFLGTLASTLYLWIVSSGFTEHTATPGGFSTISGTATIVTYTIGGGLLAMACLFFGAMIVRSGLKLWPGIWVAFGYTALAVAAFLSISAVAVASAPIEGKAALTTPAILLFALWALWFGVMLVRLKPEP